MGSSVGQTRIKWLIGDVRISNTQTARNTVYEPQAKARLTCLTVLKIRGASQIWTESILRASTRCACQGRRERRLDACSLLLPEVDTTRAQAGSAVDSKPPLKQRFPGLSQGKT
jgi:hypothetical protein